MATGQLLREEGESKVIVVGIILNEAGEVLMMRHAQEETSANAKAVLRWVFPGGFLRKGQSREECLRSSVLERTGYRVEPKYPIDLRLHPQFPYIVGYYYCTPQSPEPIGKPTHPDTAEVRWVKPADLDNLVTSEINPKVREFLKI